MDRYGNQFATRVEKNVEVGTISADVLYTPQGMYGLSVGGVILSVQYSSKDDAVDAADVILGRLAEGELAIEVLPIDGYEYGESEYRRQVLNEGPDWSINDLEGTDILPTGWDAQDHKAMYE
jgi:hypothetical protein